MTPAVRADHLVMTKSGGQPWAFGLHIPSPLLMVYTAGIVCLNPKWPHRCVPLGSQSGVVFHTFVNCQYLKNRKVTYKKSNSELSLKTELSGDPELPFLPGNYWQERFQWPLLDGARVLVLPQSSPLPITTHPALSILLIQHLPNLPDLFCWGNVSFFFREEVSPRNDSIGSHCWIFAYRLFYDQANVSNKTGNINQ